MSDTYTIPYKSMIDSIQLSTQTRQILKAYSMNLEAIKPTMLPPELLKPKFMELDAIKRSMLPPKLLKTNYMGVDAIKRSTMLPPELLKPTYMGLDAIKRSTLPPEAFKAASIGLTKILKTDQITKLGTIGLGNSMSSHINKTFDFNSVLDDTPSISEAIKLNIKAASAWNSISKTMDIESFAAIMAKNLNHNTLYPEDMSNYRNAQTNNLKSDKAIPKNNDRQPGQPTSDTDIGSENLIDENIELMEYLNKAVIDMINDGFSLPTILSVLVSQAISFTNILVKVKDAVEAYAWFAVVIIAIYKVVAKYL